ncbi:MAG: AAA family ATPase [Byssovorax sp.]
MLTRLALKNFRLLRDVTIDVEPGKPIVLIGPNSAGKSSVIHALDFLSRCAREGLKPALSAFGGKSALITAGKSDYDDDLSLALHLDLPDVVPWTSSYKLDYVMSLALSDLTLEHLMTKEEDGRSADIITRTDTTLSLVNSTTQKKEEQAISAINRERLSFEFVRSRASYFFLDELREALSSIRIYDGFLTTPLWARDVREGRLSPFDSAVISPEPRIDRRGLNLVNALYYIQSSHPDEWDELERAFRAEFPFVQRLEFPPDPAGGRIALGWRDRRYPGVRMQGHQMSEGMTSYLCILAAILSGEPATAIAFDEPDRHLHPSALRRVVDLLSQLSQRTAVFIATHSDRFLDYLDDPAGSLRVCEPTEDGVTIRKLGRDVLDEWRKDYTMSQLREQGQLDPGNGALTEP